MYFTRVQTRSIKWPIITRHPCDCTRGGIYGMLPLPLKNASWISARVCPWSHQFYWSAEWCCDWRYENSNRRHGGNGVISCNSIGGWALTTVHATGILSFYQRRTAPNGFHSFCRLLTTIAVYYNCFTYVFIYFWLNVFAINWLTINIARVVSRIFVYVSIENAGTRLVKRS